MTSIDPEIVAQYLSRSCFVEAACFGIVCSLKAPTANMHMLTGAALCGCVRPLALAQRLFEGEFVSEADLVSTGLRITPASELPYEGFFHLIEGLRLQPTLRANQELCSVLDGIAGDLLFVSRRAIERPPDSRKRHTLTSTSLAAAVLLCRFTGNPFVLAAVPPYKLEYADEIIAAELGRDDGDAAL